MSHKCFFQLKLVRGASVWVRVADGRRGDELQDVSLIKDQVNTFLLTLFHNKDFKNGSGCCLLTILHEV